MAKIPFQDVVPPEQKRSIRNVSIQKNTNRVTQNTQPISTHAEEIVPNQSSIKINTINQAKINEPVSPIIKDDYKPKEAYEYYYPNKEVFSQKIKKDISSKNPNKKIIFLGIALVAILAFIATMMTVFTSANVSVVKKQQNIEVNLDVEATKTLIDGKLRYEILKLSKSTSMGVEAKGEELVENKANGKIIIYNNFSTEPQRLISRTRFESPKGLIYRIPESVIVPGKTTKNGEEIPGSIEVEIFADEAGESYNSKKVDFTIPGFKNDQQRYTKFYARSSTDIEGGFVGKQKTIVQSERDNASKQMESKLQEEISKEIAAQIPEGLVLLNNSTIYSSRDLPQKEDGGSILLSKEVTAYVILLDKEPLSKLITNTYISNNAEWENIQSGVIDFSKLNITKKPEEITSNNNISLTINGEATVEAYIDEKQLSEKLSGIERKNLESVMSNFPGISSVKATIRPVWKQSFPENPLKIKVEQSR